MARPVTPSEAISVVARRWKAVVPIRPAGVPIFAISMASWRLHDVQDPQSAEPAKTTSHCLLSSAMTSGAAGVAAFALRIRTTALTP